MHHNYLEAKKSLGQNFLKNTTIIKRIVEEADIQAGDTVLEIGPGTGNLTTYLLEEVSKKNARLIAIEKDARAIPLLQAQFDVNIKNGTFELIEGDVLEISNDIVAGFARKNSQSQENSHREASSGYFSRYIIVANIPYYITGAILRLFLEMKNKPRNMVLMVQKEVAERVVAQDGKGSILSNAVRAYGQPHIVCTVSKGNFTPIPKVDSAVLSIRNISGIQFQGQHINEKQFFEVLHAGFAHKRKRLLSNLYEFLIKNTSKKSEDPKLLKKEIEDIFIKLSLDINIRPEHMHIEQWFALTKEIQTMLY